MSHVKAGGSTKNLQDSNPKYLGVKLTEGQTAKNGSVIVRQRGTKFIPGKNTKMGKDHTIFSTVNGKVKFTDKRKSRFTGEKSIRKSVSVVTSSK